MSATCVNAFNLHPANLKRWAQLPGSLTQHLERRLNQKLRVAHCFQQRMKPNRLEQHLAFSLPNGVIRSKMHGFCREVIMGSAKEDWILARVFVPQHYVKALSWLKNTNKKPMGRQLYKERTTSRTLLYLQNFKTCRNQFDWPFYFFSDKTMGLTAKLEQSLIRVSRIAYQSTEFLITEVYLTDLIQTLESPGHPYWSRQ